NCAGAAGLVLKEAAESAEAVKRKLTIIMEELKAAMLLTGSPDIKTLSNARHVVLGETAEWIGEM
ncbi:MAG: type 2 isopentenyl-diphosphate Delta-isomerase, partial [Candidatus Methanomethylophilaceae archaeon]|nr:type 2 isopentenyl-diphosphate Delta-isomerase [Candidatus Methanomethylophilaceae archaeon]